MLKTGEKIKGVVLNRTEGQIDPMTREAYAHIWYHLPSHRQGEARKAALERGLTLQQLLTLYPEFYR